ncbi:MAG: zinc ribbon domain-containing protein [Microcoleaceae cyanobacterium]
MRNRKLAKSINDAAWSLLRKWIEYFGIKYGRLTIAVAPEYTTEECFNCGKRIKKSLSVRTHKSAPPALRFPQRIGWSKKLPRGTGEVGQKT